MNALTSLRTLSARPRPAPGDAPGRIRPATRRPGPGRARARALALASLLAVVGWVAGCGSNDAVRVQLHVRAAPNGSPERLDLQAQVTGSQAGLRYRWFAVSGGCDPQESDTPTTAFQFAENVTRDRVTLEVWRGDRRVGSGETDVNYDEVRARQLSERTPAVQVEITTIPPSESGGPETHAIIAGKVSGRLQPGDRVVLYAFAYDYWHIQPTAQATHPIAPDQTWSNWTHTGTSYAALVVQPSFEPRLRLDLLPRVGGPVLARTVVEGRKPQE